MQEEQREQQQRSDALRLTDEEKQQILQVNKTILLVASLEGSPSPVMMKGHGESSRSKEQNYTKSWSCGSYPICKKYKIGCGKVVFYQEETGLGGSGEEGVGGKD